MLTVIKLVAAIKPKVKKQFRTISIFAKKMALPKPDSFRRSEYKKEKTKKLEKFRRAGGS